MEANILTTPGTFLVGCNYWASHAGTAMWSDWQPEVVDADLAQLAAEGLQVLRVFPLWPDFQPLTQLYGGAGSPVELRFGEEPLPDTEAGRAGVAEVMVERFRFLADRAGAHGLELIVGLVTGWMSGRLFVPPAFERLNVLTDPLAVMWEVRLVRYLVRTFKGHPAVLAWDLGNECNCMASVSREEAWLWTHAIASAIRQEDPERPIVSGMHSLAPGQRAAWRMQDQAELTDVLTTHPYPIFTPHCDQDPINTLRNGLHATSETRYYADIGGAPGLAEEVGTLGPFICSEDVAADYVRMILPSLWAHDCHGLLWWCAYDQKHLGRAPYDWDPYERELGLIREDREVKPVLREIGAFRRRIETLGLERLPPCSTQAVCILSEGQDAWGAAYSAFILAKQAGFDLTFQFGDQPLRDAELYLVPSLSGSRYFSRRVWLDLLARAEAGATLYVSHKDAMIVPFVEHFRVDVVTRDRRVTEPLVSFAEIEGLQSLPLSGSVRLRLRSTGAEVLGREADGNPVFTRTRYGAGMLYFLSLPLETTLSETPGAFHADGASPYWRLYAHIARRQIAARVVHKDHPMVGVTEHAEGADRRLAVLINYSPETVNTALTLVPGWSVSEVLMGEEPVGSTLQLRPNSAVVLRVGR
jgi:beta-galactosidase